MTRAPRRAGVWRAPALLALLLVSPAAAEPGAVDPRCPEFIPQARDHRLHDDLLAATRAGSCALVGTWRDRSQTTARWSAPDGTALELVLAPVACMDQPAVAGPHVALAPSPRLERRCPDTWRAVTDLVLSDRYGAESVIRDASGAAEPARIALLLGRVLFALTGLALLLLALRGLRGQDRPDRAWLGLAFGGFALALVVRWLAPATLSNWYTDLLGPAGPTYGRFGPGVFVFQEALRAALPWSDVTWRYTNLVVGAAAAPLAVGLARELRFDRLAGAASALSVSFAPYLVRVSASPSEHVLATTLLLTALWLWLRATRRRDRPGCATAALLAVCAVLTRADLVFVASAIPVWGVAVGWPRGGGAGRRWVLTANAGLFGVVAASAAALWWLVVVPSAHPGPALQEVGHLAQTFLIQLPVVALRPPHWISPVTVTLAIAGAVHLALSDRRLLLAVLAFLFLAFVPLGRDLDRDELLSARYFLAPIVALCLVAGAGASALLARLGARLRHPAAAPALLCACAALSLALVYDAYTARYTFQDEYDFLHEALAELPEGCTVHQVAVRSAAYERDLDCCLDLTHSPLQLAHPGLRFRALDPAAERAALPSTGCVAYYEGALCSIGDTDEVARRFPAAARRARRACANARQSVGAPPVAEAQVTDHVPNRLFDSRPRVRLFQRSRGAVPAAGDAQPPAL